MSDIVERLRAEASLTEVPKIRTHQMMDEAADEIERLRERLTDADRLRKAFANCQEVAESLHADRERLRDALREIEAGSDYMCYSHYGDDSDHHEGCAVGIARRALEDAP